MHAHCVKRIRRSAITAKCTTHVHYKLTFSEYTIALGVLKDGLQQGAHGEVCGYVAD